MKQSGTKQQPNQALLWGVLGAFVLGLGAWGYYYIFGFSSTPAPAPAVIMSYTTTAKPQTSSSGVQLSASSRPPAAGVKEAVNVGTVGQYDPTLHMDSMDVTEALEYAGSGRNIFSVNSAPPPPVKMPMPVAPARPVAPVPVVPQGPPPTPPPPPIDLKFFGMETTAKGAHQAFLLHGDDVWVASEGEIVARRYKIISVGTNSVVVEDMPNNNRQTLAVEVQ